MTLQDIIDLLLAADWGQTPRDVAITRAVLLAYAIGMEEGRKEAHDHTLDGPRPAGVLAP